MRSSAVLIVMTVLLAPLAVASCGDGGTGVGTAPPNSTGCPTDPDKVAGQPCGALNVCAYPVCESAVKCPTTTKVAYCSGAVGAKWEVSTPGDAGGFTDGGIVPPVEAGDAADASETSDAEDATDASDTSSEASSPDVSTDASASDAADSD